MLKEHNQEAYEAIKKMLKAYKECCIVAATGIGKSNIVTELLRDLKLNAMIIVPNKSLESEWNTIYERYGTEYFSIVTYQYFKLHYRDLYGFDAYIFDEAHHMGAKEWSKAIKDFKSELIDELFIGATADDNRYFDDNIKTVSNTFFNGDHIVYGLNQQEAIERGILPKAKYVCAIYNVEEVFTKFKTIELSDELKGKLNYTIQNCQSIEDILQENIPNNSPVKGIVFVDNIKNIDTGVELIKKAFPNEPIYFIHSKLGRKNSEKILNKFRNAKSGFIVSVNMLNEGNHIKGVNTIIMLRKTRSPSLYTQQIGRGLSANCGNVTIFDLVRNDTSIKNILSRLDELYKFYNNQERENRTVNKEPKISDQFIVKDYATDILSILYDINNYNRSYWTKEEDDILKEFYPSIGARVVKKLTGKTKYECYTRAKKLNIFYGAKWTEEEDSILREYYPIMGTAVADKIPGKKRHSCYRRANRLGLCFEGNKWTKEEDDILREFYPVMGSKVSDKLPGRTAEGCKNRARNLHILRESTEWTKEEDDILREFYPVMGSKVSDKLPGRSRHACRNRAGALNIMKNSTEWTKEEDDILREFYPVMGSKVSNKLPGRSKESCKSRASILNLYFKSNKWSKMEDDILKEFYPTMGPKIIDKLPGRTEESCRSRASKLNIRLKYIEWTKEEDDILREFYPVMGVDVVNKLINRSKQSCRKRAVKLGINTIKNDIKWTKEEDDILREYYSVMGTKIVNKLPGRSMGACRVRAKELNCNNAMLYRWTKEEDDILREFYPVIGSNVADKLPGRTVNACRCRAAKLGIFYYNMKK